LNQFVDTRNFAITSKAVVLATASTKVAGRHNYNGNLGTHAWFAEQGTGPGGVTYTKPPGTGGLFFRDSRVRLSDILDGHSTTAIFAEILRGDGDPATISSTDLVSIPPSTWDAPVDPGLNPNNITPLSACDTFPVLATPASAHETGLRWYHGMRTNTNYYTHSVPPNNPGRDCMRSTTLPPVNLQFQMHLASRSYHIKGVNVAFADGSVHFLRSNIDMTIWRGIGTRNGNESFSIPLTE
jgi:prepilin-type processing-associated H-X9-DG protein